MYIRNVGKHCILPFTSSLKEESSLCFFFSIPSLQIVTSFIDPSFNSSYKQLVSLLSSLARHKSQVSCLFLLRFLVKKSTGLPSFHRRTTHILPISVLPLLIGRIISLPPSSQNNTSSLVMSISTTSLWYRMSLSAVIASRSGARISVGPKTIPRFSLDMRLSFSYWVTLLR